jgi:hypothetical protein
MVSTPTAPPAAGEPVDPMRAVRIAYALESIARLLRAFGEPLVAHLRSGLADHWPALTLRASVPALTNPPLNLGPDGAASPAVLVAMMAETYGAEVTPAGIHSTTARPGDRGWFEPTRDREVIVCRWPGNVVLELHGDPKLAPVDLTSPSAGMARQRALADDAIALNLAMSLRARLDQGRPTVDALREYVAAGGDLYRIPDVIDRMVSAGDTDAAVAAAEHLAGEQSAADLAGPPEAEPDPVAVAAGFDRASGRLRYDAVPGWMLRGGAPEQLAEVDPVAGPGLAHPGDPYGGQVDPAYTAVLTEPAEVDDPAAPVHR